MENKQNILFKTEDEKISVDVRFEDDTVWLTQEQMALLFGKAKSTINEHIQNVFNEGELDEELCTKKFGISEFQQKASNYYNLDVIIPVGYWCDESRVIVNQKTQYHASKFHFQQQ